MRAIVVSLAGLALVACGDIASNDNSDVPKIQETSSQETELSVPLPPAPPKSLRLEDIDFTTYSEELARFTGLEIGQSRVEAIDNIRLYFAPEDGSTIMQTRQSSFERDDGAVLIFGASGIADDSVKAEEIFLILTGPENNQILQAFGSKIQCYRGENTTEWQNTVCQ